MACIGKPSESGMIIKTEERAGHICHPEELGLGGQPCGNVHGAARDVIRR